jgi:hypothetical protein
MGGAGLENEADSVGEGLVNGCERGRAEPQVEGVVEWAVEEDTAFVLGGEAMEVGDGMIVLSEGRYREEGATK